MQDLVIEESPDCNQSESEKLKKVDLLSQTVDRYKEKENPNEGGPRDVNCATLSGRCILGNVDSEPVI